MILLSESRLHGDESAQSTLRSIRHDGRPAPTANSISLDGVGLTFDALGRVARTIIAETHWVANTSGLRVGPLTLLFVFVSHPNLTQLGLPFPVNSTPLFSSLCKIIRKPPQTVPSKYFIRYLTRHIFYDTLNRDLQLRSPPSRTVSPRALSR
jgi:hypothetical protein